MMSLTSEYMADVIAMGMEETVMVLSTSLLVNASTTQKGLTVKGASHFITTEHGLLLQGQPVPTHVKVSIFLRVAKYCVFYVFMVKN